MATVPATVNELRSNLQHSQADFLAILERADGRQLYQRPADEGWTLAEVLVHIAEARQFYAAETQKGLDKLNIPIGRHTDHPQRLQNITDHSRDEPAVIRQRLVESHQRILAVLDRMTETDLKEQVENVRLGPQTLAEFVGRFLVSHDQTHVEQAQTILATVTATDE